MDDTQRRRIGGRALDFCVVLFLIVLRISVLALCVSYMKLTSSDNNQASTSADSEFSDVGELAKQLPNAAHPSDIFALFLEQVEKLFPFLIQVSIFLLPRDLTAFSRAQGTNAPASVKLQPLSQALGVPSAEASVRQFVDKLLSLRFVNKLDWTNCCTFHLYKKRGPVAQASPPWPVTSTAAYHAAFVASDLVRTDDYAQQGPHFADWGNLHEQLSGRSMVAIPMCACQQVVAVLGMASTAKAAFQRSLHQGAHTLIQWGLIRRKKLKQKSLFSVAKDPRAIKLLQFSTRRTEMQHMVNEIISPLASQINQCMASPKERQEEEALPNGKDKIRKRCLRPRSAPEPEICAEKGINGHDSELSNPIDSAAETHRPDLNFCVPSYSKKTTRFSFDHVCSTDIDLNWGDFVFNLINLCFVYVCFSKVAVQGQTYLAIMLCFFVATFDIVLLLLRWTWIDASCAQGGCVMFACQLYRVVVVPIANTWMSWRVLNNLDFEPDFSYVVILAILIVLCILVGTQVRFLLHTPLQILSIVFALFSTPTVCHRFDPLPSYPIVCLGSMSAVHVLIAYLVPTVMLHAMEDSKRGDATLKSVSFMPHLQVKRLSY